MELKKGYYFTLDSIVASGIILILITIIPSFYVEEHATTHLNYMADDLMETLGTLKVGETKNGYIKGLISSGSISKLDNTVLEQISEFWADNQISLANKTASNVTGSWAPDNLGIGIWINNETVYSRDVPLKKSLVSSRKSISGIKKGDPQGQSSRQNPPTLWGPVIIEVRVWE